MHHNLLPPENVSATDTPSRWEPVHLPSKTGSDEPRIGYRHNGDQGYPSDRTNLRGWMISGHPGQAGTTRAPRGSSSPGSRRTLTAWITWTGCAGRKASPARAAGISV